MLWGGVNGCKGCRPPGDCCADEPPAAGLPVLRLTPDGEVIRFLYVQAGGVAVLCFSWLTAPSRMRQGA